jgi:hypothetical protein
MKYFEIILKLLFVAGAVTFFVSKEFFMLNLWVFIIVALVLGVVLLFNKKQSYGYQLSSREVTMRRVEGVVLVVFAVVFGVLKCKGLI